MATTTNLGRVQGGGFFGSTSTSTTSITVSSVTTNGVSPLVGDTIVNANGDLCRVTSVGSSAYTVTKYGSIKGTIGIEALQCSGVSAQTDPTTSMRTFTSITSFSRTPVIGDKFSYVHINHTTKKRWLCTATVEVVNEGTSVGYVNKYISEIKDGDSIDESGNYPNMTVGQATNADTLDGKRASEFATAAQGIKADNALPSSAIGYATSGRNYGILKSASDKLYVNVPWTDSGANKLPLTGGTLTGEVKAPIFGSSDTNIDYIDFRCGNGDNFGLRGAHGIVYNLEEAIELYRGYDSADVISGTTTSNLTISPSTDYVRMIVAYGQETRQYGSIRLQFGGSNLLTVSGEDGYWGRQYLAVSAVLPPNVTAYIEQANMVDVVYKVYPIAKRCKR